jgi:large subunit ribosomal protein L28
MARICFYCGKGPLRGFSIARRGLAKKKGGIGIKITGRSKRSFLPNVQIVRAIVEGRVKRIKVCTRCIKLGRVLKPVNTPKVAQAT